METKLTACERAVIWNKENKERRLEISRKYDAKNREQKRVMSKKYRLQNKEIIAQKQKERKRIQREVYNRAEAKRSASKFKATVLWANDFYISEIYHLAKVRSESSKDLWHVDHIVPLNSSLVCGLHNEFNLQVISARQNIIKGNREWPDMPEGEYFGKGRLLEAA